MKEDCIDMEITQTLYVTDPNEWREWLEAHYKTEKEIWLVYYKKETGKPRIEYNDAVEQALCFGWIDSTAKQPGRGTHRPALFSPQTQKRILAGKISSGCGAWSRRDR
jgi:uncharacterized protein YdeI (YjbR/CyaY-like superfamily)